MVLVFISSSCFKGYFLYVKLIKGRKAKSKFFIFVEVDLVPYFLSETLSPFIVTSPFIFNYSSLFAQRTIKVFFLPLVVHKRCSLMANILLSLTKFIIMMLDEECNWTGNDAPTNYYDLKNFLTPFSLLPFLFPSGMRVPHIPNKFIICPFFKKNSH